MARENFLWGAPLIHGELLMLGFTVSQAAVSRYLPAPSNNRWYIAVPAYAGALSVGFGRMGHDAHWLSDIAGSAIIGVATTELLLWMHKRHDLNPSRFRIFPVSAPPFQEHGSHPDRRHRPELQLVSSAAFRPASAHFIRKRVSRLRTAVCVEN